MIPGPMTLWICLALAWIALIAFGGSGRFGRAGTQGIIDRLSHRPALQGFLDRWHSEIRAAFHYIEFGTLSLILYLIMHSQWGTEIWTWWAAVATLPLCILLAYLDEKRQELTPGRQFRLCDFVHSVRGSIGMQVIIALVAIVRWGIDWASVT